MTSVKIYHLAMDGEHCSGNYTDRVSHHHNFIWHGQEACQSRMVCSKLSGNPCGDYGVSVGDSSGKKKHNFNFDFPNYTFFLLSVEKKTLCLKGDLHRGQVEPHTSLSVEIWHVPSPDMNMSCYLWCTESGQLPIVDSEDLVNSTFISDFVRKITII